ncbi:MAG TPA: carboxymuconolactone decarboxylase family protein [bacterium]|jgi:AhpD family alkylhydroperoxidase
MHARIDYDKVAPDVYKAMLVLDREVNNSGLEKSLLDLIKIRASQLNGCAFCIDLHAKEARARGEHEQRIYELDAWRHTTFYTDRERAALAWTEAVTLLTVGHVPDEVYAEARRQFNDSELVNLTLAVVTINGWNRLSIAFRAVPGSHRAVTASMSNSVSAA